MRYSLDKLPGWLIVQASPSVVTLKHPDEDFEVELFVERRTGTIYAELTPSRRTPEVSRRVNDVNEAVAMLRGTGMNLEEIKAVLDGAVDAIR